MDEKLYTAAEIAAMKLSGLPTTKPSLLARAEKEEWYFEKKRGLGGMRKVFRIPALYLPEYVASSTEGLSLYEPQQQGVTVQARRFADKTIESFPELNIDHRLLAQAIEIVETHLRVNKKHFSPERKSEVVVVVYNFLNGNRGKAALEELLKLVI